MDPVNSLNHKVIKNILHPENWTKSKQQLHYLYLNIYLAKNICQISWIPLKFLLSSDLHLGFCIILIFYILCIYCVCYVNSMWNTYMEVNLLTDQSA